MVHGAVAARRPSADRIVFLGHATILIELAGVRLLTDPLLRLGVGPLRRQVPLCDASLSAAPDAVLISHLHRDHLDLASLRLLGRETPLLVPAGAGEWLGRQGFGDVRELAAGESAAVGPLTVSATPARHDGHRHPGGMRAQTLGFLVQGRGTVYFAGDTELFPGMAEISGGLAGGLDVALLPVAGWAPKLGPGHMGPLEAARAAAMLAPRLAIPIHWGTLLPVGFARRYGARLGEPPRLFAEHAARLAPEVEVQVLQPGQEASLSGLPRR
ncbi:MAG TPA: MBL fold metallo-hydrolase [Solirubrobacteraceae bacterium]|nr:MBL fold metallo-hydrolase [Solirubrobacteraceae bacterium]